MAVYKTLPLSQATNRQVVPLTEAEKSAAAATVQQFVNLFKQAHL